MISSKSLSVSLSSKADWVWIGDVLSMVAATLGGTKSETIAMWARSSPLFPEIDNRSLLICPETAFLRLTTVETSTPAFFEHSTNKKKMSTTIFGKAAIFSQCRLMNVPLHTGNEFWILLRQRKKMQRSALPERQTEQKNRCLRLPRHTGNPQLKYGKASATTAWKTKSTRTPSLVSPYEKTGDSRFAPNLLPYTGVRAVFFGVTCAVVRKVYC